MRIFVLIVSLIALSQIAICQDTVIVVEKSIKVAAMSPLTEFYGFAKGDKVIINVWVEKGKELKDFTVIEYPNTIRFAAHTVERVENKILDIPRNGIYRIDYNNTNIMPRIVNIRIQRLPRDASTRTFNTAVKWVDRVDTSYRSQDTDYHVTADTSFQEAFSHTIKVNAKSSSDNTHRTLVNFSLPANTIRWVYWIGVGAKGEQQFNDDQKKLLDKGYITGGTHPLTAVALGRGPMSQVKVGENVRYFFISKQEETQKFMDGAGFGQFRQGDMVTDFGLMNYPNKNPQTYYLGLSNDNPTQAIQVHVKILAVVVTKGYATKGESVPILSTSKVPVHEQ